MAPEKLEWCVEPTWADELLFAHETFGPVIWDPSAGSGRIPEIARKNGYLTIATDIADRNYAGLDRLLDFTDARARAALACKGVADIIFNPPYGRGLLAVQFIEIALTETRGRVAALVNDSFIHAGGRWNEALDCFVGGRHEKFASEWPISKVYHFSTRPSMPPGGLDVVPKGGQANYAWLIFDLGHKGPPETFWLHHGKAVRR